jgi:hypothetical protein
MARLAEAAMLTRRTALWVPFAIATVGVARAADDELPPLTRSSMIDLVYLGENGCPPCRAWKALELRKLEQSPEFAQIRYTPITKVIPAPVPPQWALPAHLRPMRDEMVRVINRSSGAPMFALLIDGHGVSGGWGTPAYDRLLPLLQQAVSRKLAAT